MKKKPWLAAVLNALVAGLGYIYVGKRILFGILLILGEVFAYIWVATWVFTDPEAFPILDSTWLSLSWISFAIAFAIDAYRCAKEV